MWALPLPIMMALVLTSPLQLGGGTSRSAMRRIAWVVLLAAFALLVPRYSGLSAENGVRLSWPTLKVPDAAYQWAVAVNESVPPRIARRRAVGDRPVDRHAPSSRLPVVGARLSAHVAGSTELEGAAGSHGHAAFSRHS